MKPQLKFCNHGVIEAAGLQVIARAFGNCGREQTLVKLVLGPFQYVVQMGIVFGFTWSTAKIRGHFQSRPLGKHFQRFAEVDAVLFHHERIAIAPLLTGPALVGLAIRVHRKRGIVVIVEWAKSLEDSSIRLQSDIFSDQTHDIRS